MLGPSNKVTASRQALILFSICPYCGEALCDILSIGACHLLLGRPELFDNHVICDGHATTYTLKHNGKSLIFAPLPPPEPHKAKSRKGSEKSSHKSETQEKCATSKSKARIASLMVKPNTRE